MVSKRSLSHQRRPTPIINAGFAGAAAGVATLAVGASLSIVILSVIIGAVLGFWISKPST